MARIVLDEAADVYHANTEWVSRSMLKDFRRSPRLFERKYINGKEVDDPKEKNRAPIIKGTAGHAVILEGKSLKDCFTIIPHDVLNKDGHRKGNAYKEYVKAHPGEALLLEKEVAETVAMINAVNEHKELQRLRSLDCLCEASIYWEGMQFNQRMRGDWIIPCRKEVICIDFKFVYDASPRAFTRQVEAGLWLQHAFYVEGLEAQFEKPVRFLFAAIDNKEPYRCLLHQLTASAIEDAKKAYERTKDRLEHCMISGDYADPCEKVINPIQPSQRCFEDDYPDEEENEGDE